MTWLTAKQYRFGNRSYTTGVTCAAWNANHSGAHDFAPVVFTCPSGVRVVPVVNLHVFTLLVLCKIVMSAVISS
jgi:hypothetical protein